MEEMTREVNPDEGNKANFKLLNPKILLLIPLLLLAMVVCI